MFWVHQFSPAICITIHSASPGPCPTLHTGGAFGGTGCSSSLSLACSSIEEQSCYSLDTYDVPAIELSALHIPFHLIFSFKPHNDCLKQVLSLQRYVSCLNHGALNPNLLDSKACTINPYPWLHPMRNSWCLVVWRQIKSGCSPDSLHLVFLNSKLSNWYNTANHNNFWGWGKAAQYGESKVGNKPVWVKPEALLHTVSGFLFFVFFNFLF